MDRCLCRLSREALISSTAFDSSSTSAGHRRFQSAKVLTPRIAKTKHKRVQALDEPISELRYCRTATIKDDLGFTSCSTGG